MVYLTATYKGRPYGDSRYEGGPQAIPGKVMCAYYDLGGEGVAYHDTVPVNQGSGRLNPADGSYLNEFRINESVDISYTKFRDAIDNSSYNSVQPDRDMLYVGWTEPGEWVKYTVDVKKTGTYSVNLLYTSNRGGALSISFDDIDRTGPLQIKSTYREDDPVDWRQWHHWNRMDGIAVVGLEEGIHTCTLHTVEQGQMNYAYMEFVPLKV